MSVAGGSAPVRQGIQKSVVPECRITVEEARIVALAADAVAIDAQQLDSVIFRYVDAKAEVHAPAKDVMIIPEAVLCAIVGKAR